jgi:hypothetical protein
MRYPEEARPDRTVTDGVRFLDHGLRGFYAAYDGEPVTIALGDRVFVPGERAAVRAGPMATPGLARPRR